MLKLAQFLSYKDITVLVGNIEGPYGWSLHVCLAPAGGPKGAQTQQAQTWRPDLGDALYGQVWSHMVPYGPVWSRMIPFGPVWSPFVPYGPLWSNIVP